MRKIKRNKEAILMPEVLKILIAVLCIVLLIYLAISLYGIFIQKSDLEKATSILTAIKGKAEAPDLIKTEYSIFNLKDWYLLRIDDYNSCQGKIGDSCLCLCSSAKDNNIDDNVANIGLCKSNGVCVILNNFKIHQDNRNIKQSISFASLPFNLIITKENGEIGLWTDETVYKNRNLLSDLLAYKLKDGIIVQQYLINNIPKAEEVWKARGYSRRSDDLCPGLDCFSKVIQPFMDGQKIKGCWEFDVVNPEGKLTVKSPICSEFMGGSLTIHQPLTSNLNVNGNTYTIKLYI